MKAYLVVKGNVQGVGYRFFAKQKADALGVKGFVRNKPDGSVELFGVFQDEAHLQAFLSAVERKSSSDFGMHVAGVDVYREGEDGFRDVGSFSSFEVRF